MPSSFYVDPAVQAKLTPVALAPIAIERPWGIEARASWNFAAQADSIKWGEIWLACEDFGLETKVASGPYEGKVPAWLKANWGLALTGHRATADAPALTISLRIERTGPQPGPARAMDADEFWYVLEAGAESWAGSSGPGPWPKSQVKTPLELGDAFLVPKGLVSCQGPKLTILKALPTGATVKTVHDWNRPPDLWGFTPPPKEVEIVGGELEALEPVPDGRGRRLYQGDAFEVTLVKTGFATGRGDGLSIICPIKGRGRIQSAGNPETLRLNPGQAILVPAAQSRWSVESGTLVAYLHFRLY
ncbi:MAG: hypothetical protein LBE49_01695 [Deltaproteobacteria bacterium]|nr:hypothetical protein [Deltaproteobacteria bacterium]